MQSKKGFLFVVLVLAQSLTMFADAIILQDFSGINLNQTTALGNGAIPSDMGMAVGNNEVAQFVNGAKGDGNQLMVNGFVMVGAILMNKSPVSMSQITPIAKITEETQIMVVPANSPIKNS